MGSQIRGRLKNIAGYDRLRKQKLILVRHGDLITMWFLNSNLAPVSVSHDQCRLAATETLSLYCFCN